MCVNMKNLGRVLCLLVFACAHAQSPTVAIRGITVVDVRDGSLHPEQTVLVTGNRIAAVGSVREVAVPDDAKVVEAAGGYLIPGLWDMHVHSVANVALDSSLRSVAAQAWHFPLFLAHGVTGVRNMNDGAGDVTLALTRTVRRQLAEGVLRGPPRFLSAGPSLDGDPPLGSNPVIVRTAPEARAAVQQLVSNGADLVKVYENLSREAYFAIMDEARRRRIPVDGHVPFRITPEEAAAAGQRTAEHPDALAAGCSTAAEVERKRFASVLANYDRLPEGEKFLAMFRHVRALYDSRDPSACASAIEAFRRNRVAVTADLLAYHHVVHAEQVLSDPARMRLVPQEVRRNWENWFHSETTREFQSILRPIVPLELENVRLLNEAGVLLLAATDVGVPLQVPGISLHVELERLVEAGLSPLEALRTATFNPARVLGMADSVGTIEPGKLADLVLLDADPLEDIRNTQKIRAVVADGRLYRRADLDQLLAGNNVDSSEAPMTGYILGPEEGSQVLSHLIKADPQLGSSRLGMGKQRLKAGRGIELHVHEDEEEILYVESGRGVGVVGNHQKALVAGSMMYIPQGAWHGIQSTEEMRIIWIVSPPNFANYLREWHALNESGQFSEKRYEEIRRKHQISDGRVFLRAVLGNSVWESAAPWGEIKFDAAGMKADYGGNGRPAGIIEITDSSPDALGFVGEWRQTQPPKRGPFTLYYDFKSGAEITFKSGDDPRSQSTWRKSQR